MDVSYPSWPASKTPSMVNSQVGPSRVRKMVPWSGIRSPTRHPKRSAVARPTMAPVRLRSHAPRSASVSTISG